MKPLNILLLGDASNYHNALATGFKRLGHTVTVVSDGSHWLHTRRDIDSTRRPGLLGGLIFWLKLLARRRRLFRGYDLVAISSAQPVELRPERQRSLINYLRRHNRVLVKSALGTDTFLIDECLAPDSRLAYSEYRVNGLPTPFALEREEVTRRWLADPLRAYCRHVAATTHGSVTALYEYQLSESRALGPDRVFYGGIPIDFDSLPPCKPAETRPGHQLKIFIGYTPERLLEKGAHLLLEAARRVVERHPDRCTLVEATHLPYADFVQLMSQCDIILDQSYSYTPATTALLAMAMGKVVFTGGEEDYYRFIDEETMHPIVNVIPDVDTITATLEQLVLNPGMMEQLAADGPRFVARHNDCTVVASRYIEAYNRLKES